MTTQPNSESSSTTTETHLRTQHAYRQVLLIDDDPYYSNMMHSALLRAGFGVSKARTLKEASTILNANSKIGLVIVDGLLPDGNGIEWLAKARAGGFDGKAIFASAFWRDRSSFVELTQNAKANVILRKPFTPSELLMQTERLLGGSTLVTDESLTLSQMAEEFRGTLKAGGATIEMAVSRFVKDPENTKLRLQVRFLAHRLSGTASAFGLTDVADYASQLEQATTLTDPWELTSECKSAMKYLTAAIRESADVLNSGDLPLNAFAFDRSRSATTGAKVLLVDDDPIFAARTAFVLSQAGYEVIQCHESNLVLMTLSAQKPDILLLDLVMPGGDGLTLCSRIRSDERWVSLPIVVLTGKTGSAVRIAVGEAGADDYMPKNITPTELIAQVNLRIQHVRMRLKDRDTDPLTKLQTRAGFTQQFERQLSKSQRLESHLKVCILDIDHFKQINDSKGHLQGDKALKILGTLLRENLRLEDLKGRWGGDEFVLSFPDAESEKVTSLLQRINTGFSIQAEKTLGIHGVSFSAGVASFPEDGSSLESLLEAADRRLYAAKAAGRKATHASDAEFATVLPA